MHCRIIKIIILIITENIRPAYSKVCYNIMRVLRRPRSYAVRRIQRSHGDPIIIHADVIRLPLYYVYYDITCIIGITTEVVGYKTQRVYVVRCKFNNFHTYWKTEYCIILWYPLRIYNIGTLRIFNIMSNFFYRLERTL